MLLAVEELRQGHEQSKAIRTWTRVLDYSSWGVAQHKSRNKSCFEKKIIRNLIEVVCHIRVPMRYWTGLYAEMDQEQLIEGINTMLRGGRRNPSCTIRK